MTLSAKINMQHPIIRKPEFDILKGLLIICVVIGKRPKMTYCTKA